VVKPFAQHNNINYRLIGNDSIAEPFVFGRWTALPTTFHSSTVREKSAAVP